MNWVFWINTICKWYGFVWIWSGLFCMLDKHYFNLGWLGDFSRRFIGETKPFYFLFVGGYYVSLSLMDKFHWYTPLLSLWDVVLYYVNKDNGDDHWKRRMEKLREKVEVSEGKLVVVPN